MRRSRKSQQTADAGGPDRRGRGDRSRRGLLAAGAGAVGLAAVKTVAWAAPAQASNGQPVLLGVTNNATAVTEIDASSSSGSVQAKLAVPSAGVGVLGSGPSTGVSGVAEPGSNGDGAIGQGVAVSAQHTSGGTALQVVGTAVFSRSGTLTIRAGASSVTQTGVALTAASLILATLQRNVPGVYVQSAVPDVPKSSFTIHLSQAAPASTTVAWFIVN